MRVLLTRDDDRQRADRRAHGAREQQQGRSVHQPARQRVGRGRPPPAPTIFIAAFDETRREARRPAPANGVPDVRRRLARHRARAVGSGADAAPRPVRRRSRDCSSSSCAIACRCASAPSIGRRFACSSRRTCRRCCIEMGYLTNPEQEKQLTRRRVPERAWSQAIFEAVVEFRDSLDAGGGRR